MLVVPLLEVGIFQTTRKAVAIIARGQINPGLGGVAQTKLRKLDDALGAHKAGDFGRFRAQRQAHVHRDICVLKENRMHVGRVAPIFPAVNAAKSRCSFGSFIDSENKLHAADQVNKQVARYTGAIFLPATPARE